MAKEALYRIRLVPSNIHAGEEGLELHKRYRVIEKGQYSQFSPEVKAKIKGRLERICDAAPDCVVEIALYDQEGEDFRLKILPHKREFSEALPS